jgi:CheY-like chemotaxis protein
MDGFQAARALRAAGFDHHLLKPAFPEQVQAILSEGIAQARATTRTTVSR